MTGVTVLGFILVDNGRTEMGMYTEIYVRAELRHDTPDDVIKTLRFMFDESYQGEPSPNHPDGERWQMVGKGGSFYHIPQAVSEMWKRYDSWYIVSRSDLKNYDEEIEKFFTYLLPYVEPGFVGYSLYEEDDWPELYVKSWETGKWETNE